ncbi:amidohydrolase [Desulfovibrio sp. OttesenSCG-928-C06]|nr:amidohydrolase [Desulfovibrio sp. OttesenSCG-928-C06]
MMIHTDLIVSADLVLTQNDSRELIENGAVAVSNGVLQAVGKADEIRSTYTAGRDIALTRSLLMPGLINAHTHMPMTLLRGKADDLPLMTWLTEHIFPLEAKLTPHMLQVGTRLACAEMLRTGTTAFNDMYLNEPQVYRTVDECGMRAMVGEGLSCYPTLGCSDPALALEVIGAQADELAGNRRIKYCVAPHSVYTTNEETLAKCADFAQKRGLPLHIHLAESKTETAQSLKMHGARPVEVCRRQGVLGPSTTAAHCVDLTDAEMDILAETRTVVAHNPRSNMKLASGAAPVDALLKKGARLGLGTDGASSNNSLNMFAEMSACALMHKLVNAEATSLPAQTVLDMATLGGAEALHWPGLGRLVPGSPADFIALDLGAPNMQPMYEAASHLAYAASGHEVSLTVVDGQVLYENGSFSSIDYPGLLEEVREIQDWMRRQ